MRHRLFPLFGRGTSASSALAAGAPAATIFARCAVREHSAVLQQSLVLPQPFVAGKEEGLILPDRSANRPTKVIALQRRLIACRTRKWKSRRSAEGTIKVVARIQRLVAEVVERLAVEIVGARLRADVDDRTRASAILRRERRVIDLELRRRVDRRLERNLVLAHVVQVDAVDLEVHRVFAIARQ